MTRGRATAEGTPRRGFDLDLARAEAPTTASSTDWVAELQMRLRRIAAEVRAAASVLDDVLAAGVLDEVVTFPGLTNPSYHLDELSPRQAEVLSRLLRGERVPTIAAHLYVTPSTVRNHLSAVFRRLNVHSQLEVLELLRHNAGDS